MPCLLITSWNANLWSVPICQDPVFHRFTPETAFLLPCKTWGSGQLSWWETKTNWTDLQQEQICSYSFNCLVIFRCYLATLSRDIASVVHDWKSWTFGRMIFTGDIRSTHRKTFLQCQFVHQKSHMDQPGIEPVRRRTSIVVRLFRCMLFVWMGM